MPKIKITGRFTEERTNRLFGPGEWDVDEGTYARLIAAGKGKPVGVKTAPVKAPPKAPPQPPATNPRIPVKAPEGTEAPEVTPLPEDFPSRDVLTANGFETVESLKAPDVKEQLDKIDGLGAGEVTKIGLAISLI
jgi:hypothetical protein